jgi:predicted secreted protein
MTEEFRMGAAGVLEFIDTSGTITFTTQYTNISLNYEGDTIDVTAGQETVRRFLSSITQWSSSFEAFVMTSSTPAGTAQVKRFSPTASGGISGTARISPFGTASGKFRHYGNVIITARNLEYPFDDAAVMSVDFQGSGTLTEDTW